MRDRGDDDALIWDGDDDPTLTSGAGPASPVAKQKDAAPAAPLPEGFRAVGRGSETVAPADDEPPALGNAALVAIGMLAAAYLLFAIGWLIAGFRLQAVGTVPVAEPTLAALTFAAAAAPVAWFVAVYALTRHARTWVRFAWLVAGVLLLVPWPFVGPGSFA